jgi:MFS family permease
MLAMTASSAAIPLLTQVYQENYPASARGKLFSRTFMIRIAAAALFSEFAGRALSDDIEHFRWLLLVFAAAFAFAALCLNRVPSSPLSASEGTHPFRALRFVRQDKLFRRTLAMWMLMGFSNLMIIPLRVEYLANEKYGVRWEGMSLTAARIALLTGVIPNLARLVMSPVWGWMFDRMNFFALRIALNIGFALGMLTFFATASIPGLVAGAIIYGISTAGGDVAWSLWVTKFAPPGRVADYMSVHAFFTGVRSLFAPAVAFQLATVWSPQAISWLATGLIVLATAILLPELKSGKRGRDAAALVEEVSE